MQNVLKDACPQQISSVRDKAKAGSEVSPAFFVYPSSASIFPSWDYRFKDITIAISLGKSAPPSPIISDSLILPQ
jgi:hypothetical protein